MKIIDICRKYKILLSCLGLFFLSLIFYKYASSYEAVFSSSIVIKKPKQEVFHTFFTIENLSTWFPDVRNIEAKDQLHEGSQITFHFKKRKVNYEIIELREPNYVKWKNFNSYQEFIFENNTFGSVVHYRFYMRGITAFIFQFFHKGKIQDHLFNTLHRLKVRVETR